MSLAMGTPKPRLLKVQEVADHFATGPEQVHRWIRKGQLRAIRIGRLIRLEPAAVADFEAQHRLGTE
jgi:excisionase family DNA binding protein